MYFNNTQLSVSQYNSINHFQQTKLKSQKNKANFLLISN